MKWQYGGCCNKKEPGSRTSDEISRLSFGPLSSVPWRYRHLHQPLFCTGTHASSFTGDVKGAVAVSGQATELEHDGIKNYTGAITGQTFVAFIGGRPNFKEWCRGRKKKTQTLE